MVTTIQEFEEYVTKEGYKQIKEGRYEKNVDDKLRVRLGYNIYKRSVLEFSAVYTHTPDPDNPDKMREHGHYSTESLEEAMEEAKKGIGYFQEEEDLTLKVDDFDTLIEKYNFKKDNLGYYTKYFCDNNISLSIHRYAHPDTQEIKYVSIFGIVDHANNDYALSCEKVSNDLKEAIEGSRDMFVQLVKAHLKDVKNIIFL